MIAETTQLLMQFIQNNQIWEIPIVFLLAFGESLAIFSLLIPATAILLGIGALIGTGSIGFFPVFIAASTGAIIGDWLSFWLGKHYHEKMLSIWPLNKNPKLVQRGESFFHHYGTLGVFIGRFFGPLRAIVPLIAGTLEMSPTKFNLANFTSAPIWAFVLLAPGAFGIPWLETMFG